MDDELVRRIQLYLNENHERDYMLSRDYEHDLEFERELRAQKFDVEGYEKAKEEGRKAWLSDYARQQELVFELKAEQVKIDAALRETSKAVDRASNAAKKKEMAKMQGMDLEQWRQLEKKQNDELKAQRRRLTSAIEAVAGGDPATKAALEKALVGGDAPGAATGKAAGPLLAAQIEVHEKLLEEHRGSGTDPISVLSKRIIEERTKLGLPVTDPALQEYVLLDKFGSQRGQRNQAHQPRAAGANEKPEDQIEKGVMMSEDMLLE